MMKSCILWLVATVFFTMNAAADDCIGRSTDAGRNNGFSVDGRFDAQEQKWSYVYTNIKTGENHVGALAAFEAHAHLFFFISQDGASFAVLDASAGHRLTDRFLVFKADGKLMASLGLQDILTTEEQKDVQEGLSHIEWLNFDSMAKSYGKYIQEDNAVRLTTRANRRIFISLADGKLIKKKG